MIINIEGGIHTAMFTCGPDCCLGDEDELTSACGGKKLREAPLAVVEAEFSPTGRPGEKEGGTMSTIPEMPAERLSWIARIPPWFGLGMRRAEACAMLRLALYTSSMCVCVQKKFNSPSVSSLIDSQC